MQFRNETSEREGFLLLPVLLVPPGKVVFLVAPELDLCRICVVGESYPFLERARDWLDAFDGFLGYDFVEGEAKIVFRRLLEVLPWYFAFKVDAALKVPVASDHLEGGVPGRLFGRACQ
jgi:hypothetical protein